MADGTVTIDLDLNTGSIASDVDTVKDIFKSFGADVDTATIEQKFNDAFNRVENKADATIDAINDKSVSVKVDANDTALKEKIAQAVNLLSKLPEEKRTQLVAQLHEQGFNDFKELLEYIPKEKHTELLADIQEGNISKFNSLINHVKKEKTTELKANDNNLVEKVDTSKEKLDEIPKEKTTELTAHETVSPEVEKITTSEDRASEHTHTLKDVMMGTFAGGLIQSGVSAITSGIKQMAEAGQEYNVQQDTMKINWENLTREAPQDGQNMISMINDFSQRSIYSAEALDKMAQSFYHVHSNAQETKQWTQDFVNLGSTLHVSNDALAESAEMFAKIEAGGKANAEDMQVMINRFPMFGEALQQATGKSMSQLYKLSAQGKLTSQVFSQALDYLGNKYKSSQAEAMNSFQGMSMFMKSAFSRLSGEVESGFFNMSKDAMGHLRDLVNSPYLNNFAQEIAGAMSAVTTAVVGLIDFIAKNSHAFSAIGDAFQQTFNVIKTVIGGFKQGFEANFITPLTNGGANKAIDDLKTKFDNFAKAISPLVSQVGEFIGILGAGAFRAVSDAVNGVTSAFKTLGSTTKNSGLSQARNTIVNLGIAFNQVVVAIEPFIISLAKIGGFLAIGAFETFEAILHGVATAVSLVAAKFEKLDGSSKKAQGLAHSLDGIASHSSRLKAVGAAIGAIGTALLGLKAYIGVTSKIQSGFDKVKKSIDYVGKSEKELSQTQKFVKTFVTSIKSGDGAVKSLTKSFKALSFATKANIFGAIIIGITTVTVALVELYRHNAKFHKFVNGLIKDAKSFFSSGVKWFKNAFKAIGDFFKGTTKWQKTLKKSLNNMIKSVINWGKDLGKGAKNAITYVKNTISSGMKKVVQIWNSIWQGISDFFSTIWSGIVRFAKWYIDTVKDVISSVLHIIQNIWNTIWKAISDFITPIWEGIKRLITNAINIIHDVVNDVLGKIQDIWNTIWKAISDFITPIWSGIKHLVSDTINAIHDTISNVLDKIHDVWTNMWNSLSSFFGGIWDNIKKYAADGINGVLSVINAGIDGIDAVWKFFTGHETSIHHLKPVHFEQGGIVERRLSMVNDGAGPDWKELIETPDGQLMMSNERNAVLPLEPGTRVYNGAETKAIMNMMGVEHYANGGVVGDVIDWSAHKLSDFGSWIKDKWDAVTKFLKHPIENTKAIISKAIDGPIAKLENSNMVDLARGVFDKLTKPISDWFKKGLQKAKDEHDAESSGGFGKAPDLKNGAELRDVIKNALQANGLPTSDDYINAWLRQVATESGGNAHAVQPGADPDGDGSGPAIGLLQTKRSTFNANAFPGHNDIFNAYDNALAAIHYAKGRYGSDMLAVIGHGHGYYKGGHVLKPEYALIGERGDEFVINSREPSADRLLLEAAQERLMYNPNSIVANAITSMNNAKSMNGYVAPTISYANNSAINAVNNNQNNINDKDVNVSFVIDGRTVAQKTFPFIKMMQSNDITLQSRKGAY